MQRLNKSITHAVDRPVKVMQFGEGNFLRAFVDYIFDVTNEKTDFNGGVVIVKPIEFGTLERFHDQECQYTLQLRGFVDGQPKEITRQITSVVDAVAAIEDYDKYIEYGTSETLRFIVSNTTEAGIVFDETDNDPNARPPKTYPGKLTQLLYKRYQKFNGAADKGLILLPCELIADNGIELKKCIMNSRIGLTITAHSAQHLLIELFQVIQEKMLLSFAKSGAMKISLSTEQKCSVSGL